MPTAILYQSKHGTTEKVATLLALKLNDPIVELINLKQNNEPQLDRFDTIILGGSIHFGTLSKRLKRYCHSQQEALLKKTIGLFLCCMHEGELAQKQFEEAFPERLRNSSKCNRIVGGEFLFERMNFFERLIVRKVVRVKQSQSKLLPGAINELAGQFTAK